MKDKIFGVLQRVGRAFMLPIALLPVAGLLLGIGGSFTNEVMLESYGLTSVMGEGTVAYTILTVMSEGGMLFLPTCPLFLPSAWPLAWRRRKRLLPRWQGLSASSSCTQLSAP